MYKRQEVEGATGYTDTNFAGKGQAAINALDQTDVGGVHVEATDEASHEGDVDAKIKALQDIDQHIVGPVHESLKSQGDYRIMVTPDHPTPVRTKTHSHGTVPFGICGTGIDRDSAVTYDDISAADSRLQMPVGHEVMKLFLGD